MRKLTFDYNLRMFYKLIKNHKSVMDFPYQSIETIREYQLTQIRRVIKNAYEHVLFYKRRFERLHIYPDDIKSFEDFEKLPSISKIDLFGHEEEFIDDRLKNKPLIVSKTSGSSGRFVDIYCDSEMFITEEIQVLRMIKELEPHYNALSREVLVYTSEYPVSSILGFYKVYYVNNLKSVEYIFEFILNKKPTVLAIYPSILWEIAKNIKYEFKKLKLKLIITNSEQSSQSERNFFSSLFGCTVIDEYSSEELQSIAYQCSEMNYHEVSDCTYIELLKSDSDCLVELGEVGEITGTCFLNQAMPLIRYRQGDLAKRLPGKCACNKHTPIIGNPEGRKNSSFITNDGTIIPSGRLLDWTYSLVLRYNLPIDSFQIIQKTISDVHILLKLNIINSETFSTDFVKTDFINTFGPIFKIYVNIVDEIYKTKSGKYNPIISYVNQDGND